MILNALPFSVQVLVHLMIFQPTLRYLNYDTRELLKSRQKSGSIDSSLSAQFNRTSLVASDAEPAEIRRFVFRALYDSAHAQ